MCSLISFAVTASAVRVGSFFGIGALGLFALKYVERRHAIHDTLLRSSVETIVSALNWCPQAVRPCGVS